MDSAAVGALSDFFALQKSGLDQVEHIWMAKGQDWLDETRAQLLAKIKALSQGFCAYPVRLVGGQWKRQPAVFVQDIGCFEFIKSSADDQAPGDCISV